MSARRLAALAGVLGVGTAAALAFASLARAPLPPFEVDATPSCAPAVLVAPASPEPAAAHGAPGVALPGPGGSVDEPVRGEAADAGLDVDVFDEHGVPVPLAVATAVAGERDLAVAHADDRGRARLPASTTAVRGEAPGHWPTVAAVAGDAPLRIVLQRAPRLRGRVFTSAGAPCASARVALLPIVAGRCAWPASLPPAAPCTSCDRDGTFELPWPDARAHDLVAAAHGDAAVVLPALLPAVCAGAPLVVRLAPPAGATGTVQCGEMPLADAAVELWSAAAPPAVPACGPPAPWGSGQLLAAARTDALGAFVFTDVGAGPAWVVVPAEATHQHVVLRAYTTARVQLAVAPRARVRGAVAGGGTQVFAYGGSAWLQRAAVDAHGAFELAPMPAGRYLVGAAGDAPDAMHVAIQQFLLTGRAEGAQLVDLAAGAEVVLHLAGAAGRSGSVIGSAFAAGSPAAGCRVVVETVPAVDAWRRSTFADDAGAFRFDTLVPGDYEVRWFDRAGKALGACACRVTAGAATPLTLGSP